MSPQMREQVSKQQERVKFEAWLHEVGMYTREEVIQARAGDTYIVTALSLLFDGWLGRASEPGVAP